MKENAGCYLYHKKKLPIIKILPNAEYRYDVGELTVYTDHLVFKVKRIPNYYVIICKNWVT